MKIDAYEPINTPVAIGERLWLVEGPVIGFRYLGLTLPFPTRMTIARLDDGALWVHSPTELTPTLKSVVDALGPVRHLIAPNQIHYWWLGAWQRAYPEARSYAPPGDWRRARARNITFDRLLTDAAEAAWAGQIDQVIVPGSMLTEADFYHRRSRTLILTDLIENFEARKVRGALSRALLRWAGVMDPDGGMPRDMRFTFRNQRAALRAAVRRMIDWEPERVVLAHGRWYRENGTAELKRAFRWLGPL